MILGLLGSGLLQKVNVVENYFDLAYWDMFLSISCQNWILNLCFVLLYVRTLLRKQSNAMLMWSYKELSP